MELLHSHFSEPQKPSEIFCSQSNRSRHGVLLFVPVSPLIWGLFHGCSVAGKKVTERAGGNPPCYAYVWCRRCRFCGRVEPHIKAIATANHVRPYGTVRYGTDTGLPGSRWTTLLCFHTLSIGIYVRSREDLLLRAYVRRLLWTIQDISHRTQWTGLQFSTVPSCWRWHDSLHI